ncbi:MAG: aldehyde ferredoxin oxidoreductase family protein [Actinomycetota bacterium]
MIFGYANNLIYINLSTGNVEKRKIKEHVARQYFGGAGLAAYLYLAEFDINSEPFDPKTPIIFTTGPFTGTKVPSSGRHSVASKSPLTGIWGEADVGGTFGDILKRNKVDGIVVYGSSKIPVYIIISEDNVQIKNASHLWGKDTYETYEILNKEVGNIEVGKVENKISAMVIGQAGENLVRFASIMTDGKHGRALGRCGMGAVMGSKNLKAIVTLIKKSRKKDGKTEIKIPIAYPNKLIESIRKVVPDIVKASSRFRKYGTAGSFKRNMEIGDVPVKNWISGRWLEGGESLNGKNMVEIAKKGNFYCAKCPIGCGGVAETESPYGKIIGSIPEYETISMLGANCYIDDMFAVMRANEVCNRYGLDTISTGSVIAFAMEAYEKGYFNNLESNIEIKWGDANTVLKLIKMIAFREKIGDLLAEGVRIASEKLGNNSKEFAIHCKGLELPAHDPRTFSSLALAYATGNRGGCHLQALSHIMERSFTIPELGYDNVLDKYSTEGKAEMVVKMQNYMAILDSLKICKFLIFYEATPKKILEWLNLITDWNLDFNEFLKAGERIYNLKRIFNCSLGMTRRDDILPLRVLTYRKDDNDMFGNIIDLDKLLNDYYEVRGWDENGVPTKEKLEELNLTEFSKFINT